APNPPHETVLTSIRPVLTTLVLGSAVALAKADLATAEQKLK
ncbi:MAG: hypothetical protein QOC78_3957, partial [Solirubrobacteraceae bacterium]|nr:hypothetical protein [Solirubrobacteraceae bacterium]